MAAKCKYEERRGASETTKRDEKKVKKKKTSVVVAGGDFARFVAEQEEQEEQQTTKERTEKAQSSSNELQPTPYSQLAKLDEGMNRCFRANRKRSREAQTLLKRAKKLKEVKFFNRLQIGRAHV